MSYNSFGKLFRFTTWGESHGPAIGVVVDGCPPGLPLSDFYVQQWLDQRKPGGPLASQRQEPDAVTILSGTYEDITTGTPISMIIENVDQRPKDYESQAPRPGHADATYEAKYGRRDPRGGGRASARETAARVAAGAVARLLIPDIAILSHVIRVGGEINPSKFEATIGHYRREGDSIGGVVETTAEGVPAGWGAPLYSRLDADLGAALLSIPACKAVEMGDGLVLGRSSGATSSLRSLSDGGILGGISDGSLVVTRAFFKPTSSTPLNGVKGRHDPCIAWRAPPICAAMVALVLADHKLLHRGQCG